MFLNEAQSATITREKGDEATLEVGGELTGLLGKLLGKYQSRESAKEARQIVLKPPTAQTLAEVCGVMVETLMRHKLAEHLLVLVDDVDLLDYAAPSPQQARVQRSLLTDALCTLHGQPGVDVVVTARSWFVYSGKDLTQLVDLTQSALPPEVLIAIHDNHIRQFAAKAGLRRFLTPDALQAFAMVVPEGNNPFVGTALDNLFVFQSYHNERCYFTSPLIRRIFADPPTEPAQGEGL
jgi:hypothetical protein